MTDDSRGVGGAVGPPWSVDVLADLQAGVLDEQQAAELWPLVRADAEAQAILEALELTTADLASLSETDAEYEPIPAEYAARIDAALATEMASFTGNIEPPVEAPIAPVVGIDVARRKRRTKIAGWGAGVVGIAAAAIAAIAIVVPSGGDNASSPPVAQPAPGQGADAPLSLRKEQLDIGSILQSQGRTDFGPLGTQERLDQCLTQNGFDPGVKPAGVRGVTVDGEPATLVLMTTGQLGQFRLVALSPTCAVTLDNTVGGR